MTGIQSFPSVQRLAGREHPLALRDVAPAWPGNARCVVAITVDYDGVSNEVGRGWHPLGVHSGGRYSARCGVPRFLDMLDRQGVPATFFVPGYDAITFPESVRSIVSGGHEIGAHGYKHEGVLLPPLEERDRLHLTHRILGDLMGQAPRGWRSPGGQKTSNTLEVLTELGYVYDSSDKDADLPYMLRLADGNCMPELPNNTLSLDDHPWFAVSRTPVSEVEAQWIAEFDATYARGGFYMLVVHPRGTWGSGTPRRAQAVESVIRHARQHEGVRFVRLQDLAAWVTEKPDQFDEVASEGFHETALV